MKIVLQKQQRSKKNIREQRIKEKIANLILLKVKYVDNIFLSTVKGVFIGIPGSFEILCWRRSEKIEWSDMVKKIFIKCFKRKTKYHPKEKLLLTA